MIGIVTDSTCDIPENLLEQYGIIVVPQFVTWADKQYRDRVDLQPGEFYQRLKTESELPHTSMPGVADFKNAFDQAIEQGANELIVLTVSSAMSGTYEVARTAAAQLTIPVTVVDSKGPTMTLGWQTLAAARARDADADMDDIIARVATLRQKLVQVVAMQSIEYLERGGRIGDAAKWVGTLLKVKPVVRINHKTGRVEPAGLARTHGTHQHHGVQINMGIEQRDHRRPERREFEAEERHDHPAGQPQQDADQGLEREIGADAPVEVAGHCHDAFDRAGVF